MLGRSARARRIVQSLPCLQGKEAAPFAYSDFWDIQVRSDLLIRSAGGRFQNNATAERQCLRVDVAPSYLGLIEPQGQAQLQGR